MSRRKQLKPQPVKDDVLSSSDVVNGEETRPRKRSFPNDVKAEPSCNDEVRSLSTNDELKLNCQFCGASYETISDLQSHTIRDHVPMPTPSSLECQHCFATLPSFAAFVIHMRGHLNDREDTRCSKCPLSFIDTQSRLLHLVSHFEVRKTSRVCVECGISVADNLMLGQHFIKRHLRIQHLCMVCGQTNDTQREFIVSYLVFFFL
ncbi:zinc finger, C2H2 type [Dictyocaulus viviparus]|uniref:Zinc finger, C2H2 type n=1 Tax=Dictyocaulus viviparus TaxID=29172 RepID=A0A0D8Y3W4_DICVI|nr:zinc finger, C2H2 type [Dictyocaulus viviparus]